jgi:hypothetical protein
MKSFSFFYLQLSQKYTERDIFRIHFPNQRPFDRIPYTMMKLAILAALTGTSAAFAPANLGGMLPRVSGTLNRTPMRIDDTMISL